MNGLDRIERNASSPKHPVPRRGLGVIEGVVRLAGDNADKGERRLMIATRGEAELNVRRRRVIRDHAPEQISRDAADKTRGCAEPRDADRDV